MPGVDEILGFNGSKTLVSKALTVAAHNSTHLAGGSDELAWATINGYGVNASKPAAGPTNAGYVYFSTDVNGGTLYRSDGTGWTALTAGLSTGSPADATYILQTADGDLPNAQALGSLATGIVKNTTSTGVLLIAVENVDYAYPSIVTASAPTTGQTVTAGTAKRDETLNIEPAGTLASLTISFPTVANTRVGQVIQIFISQIITSLTLNTLSTGSIVGSAPNTASANSSFAYQATSVSGSGVWKRLY